MSNVHFLKFVSIYDTCTSVGFFTCIWWRLHIVANVLGVSQACCWEECCVSNVTGNSGTGSGGVGWDRSSGRDQPQPSPTPPTQRRLAKSFSVTPSAVTKGISVQYFLSPIRYYARSISQSFSLLRSKVTDTV